MDISAKGVQVIIPGSHDLIQCIRKNSQPLTFEDSLKLQQVPKSSTQTDLKTNPKSSTQTDLKTNPKSSTQTDLKTKSRTTPKCSTQTDSNTPTKSSIPATFTQNLLVLDPATSTGYCIVKVEKEKANIHEYGFIDVKITSNYQGDHCISLMNSVLALITKYQINHIAIEDYFFSNKFRSGSNVNGAFRTAIHILARQNNIDYTILNISAWKVFVAKRATPTKEQKIKWGTIKAKKLYMQQALYENFGFRFPNASLSLTTNKPIIFRYDIVDVVGQACYYCGLICGIRKDDITLSVNYVDIVWHKKPLKMFDYDEYKAKESC